MWTFFHFILFYFWFTIVDLTCVGSMGVLFCIKTVKKKCQPTAFDKRKICMYLKAVAYVHERKQVRYS